MKEIGLDGRWSGKNSPQPVQIRINLKQRDDLQSISGFEGIVERLKLARQQEGLSGRRRGGQ